MIHLPIGGSTFKRFTNCPNWLVQAKGLANRSGVAADLGNLKHDAMELYYRDNVSFSELVGKLVYNGITLTKEQVTESLIPAVEATEDVLDEYEIEDILLEQFVQAIPDLAGGSIDMFGVSPDGKTALFLDYKFGAQEISPHTLQLKFYAMCAAYDEKTAPLLKNVEKLVCAIVQPTINKAASIAEFGFREVVHTTRELLAEGLENPDRLAAGPHCRFCPAAAKCPEPKSKALAALVLNPEDSATHSKALQLARQLKSWINQVEDLTLQAAEAGAQIPGFKLIEGPSRRVWADNAEDTLKQQLGEKAYKTTLINLTTAEKLLGKKEVSALNITTKPAGKYKLVNDSAKGEAVKVTTPRALVDLVNSKPANSK